MIPVMTCIHFGLYLMCGDPISYTLPPTRMSLILSPVVYYPFDNPSQERVVAYLYGTKTEPSHDFPDLKTGCQVIAMNGDSQVTYFSPIPCHEVKIRNTNE